MSLITRIVLLVLAVPFVLAHGDDCGNDQFKYVLWVDVESHTLTRILGGTLRTSAFPEVDRGIPPTHLPTLTVPSTGRGTLERAAVLLTSLLIPFLLLSVAEAGTGALAPFAATLPHPAPPPPIPLPHPGPPESPMEIAMMTRTARVVKVAMAMATVVMVVMVATVVTTTSASLPRSVNSVPAMLPLALSVSLLAPSPA